MNTVGKKPAVTQATKTSSPFFAKGGEAMLSNETSNGNPSFFSSSQNTFFKPGNAAIQTKLTIGKPNDKYEQEADHIADKVVQRLSIGNTSLKNNIEAGIQSKPVAPLATITPLVQTKPSVQHMPRKAYVQKKCAGCEQEEKVKKKEEKDKVPLKGNLQKKPIFESNAPLPDDVKKIQRKCAACLSEDKSPPKAYGTMLSVDRFKPVAEQANAAIKTTRAQGLLQPKCATCREEEIQKNEEGEGRHEKDMVQKKPIFESNKTLLDDKHAVQRKCAHCEADEKESKVQKKSSGESAAPGNIESGLQSSKGGGHTLPDATRLQMESSFGADFSKVRIHENSSAVQMSKDISAQAFTHGSDIYFNSGKYDTSSNSGKNLLAHELTHVVQQGAAFGKSIQRIPDNTSKCDKNAVPKLSIDDVTKNCPSLIGDITEGMPKTVNIKKLKVKSNAPQAVLDILGKNFTLPKPGLRADNPTKQITVWNNLVRADVNGSLETALALIDQNHSIAVKKDPKNIYTLKLKTGQGTAVITGSFSELQNGALISKWNTEGITMAFQVEHILDYQVAAGKADNKENLMLLSAAVNNNLGSVMKEFIRSDISGILKHYNEFIEPGKLVTSADEARENYNIVAKDTEKIPPTVPPDQEILASTLKEATKNPLRDKLVLLEKLDLKKDHFILKSNKKGGGIILPYVQNKFSIGSYELTTDGKLNDDGSGGTISKIMAMQILNGNHTEGKPEVEEYILTPTGEAQTFKAAGFGNKMANLKLHYLSLIEFEPPDLDEGLNITAKGFIKAPSPSFLKNTPIEVFLIGRDLSIQKTFAASELGSIGPIKIDEAALTLSLSTQSGFGASGLVDFSISKVGKGQITATGNNNGFELKGKFNFDTKTFDKATITVGYESAKDKEGGDAWEIGGILSISKGKIKGIDNAIITVAYKGKVLSFNGNANLNVPGVKSASIDATYIGGAFNLSLTTQFDFKSKYIQDPNITVTLSSGGDGDENTGLSLGISGSVNIVIPNFKTINASIKYDKGTFETAAAIDDIKVGKFITGNITLGATNALVNETTGKKDATGEGKELHLFGTGSIKIQLGEHINQMVNIKFTQQGKILISGELKVENQPLLNKENLLKFRQIIFEIGTPDIPIFSIGIGDIFLHIEGNGYAMADIGVPMISVLLKLQDTDIFDPKSAKIDTTITPEIKAEAGIDLGVKFIIGVRALVLNISANVGGTLKLHVVAGAKANLNLSWSANEGLQFIPSVASLDGAIVISGAITGGISVDLNLFLTKINLWKKDWELAKMDFGNLGQLSLKFPFQFDENGSFKTPDTKSLKLESPLSEKGGAEKFLSDKAGGGENKVVKKIEDFKKEIIDFFYRLPAIGPASPRYAIERGRYFFINEIQQLYPDGDWNWLKAEWASIELTEFYKFADKLRRSSNPNHLKNLETFTQNHTTVSRDDIDMLADELKAIQEKKTSKPKLQTKLLEGFGDEQTNLGIQNDEKKIQTKTKHAPPGSSPSSIENNLSSSVNSGSTLPKETKKEMDSFEEGNVENSNGLSIQKKAADELIAASLLALPTSPAAPQTTTPATPALLPPVAQKPMPATPASPTRFVVEDNASPAIGQMRKTEFLKKLKEEVCISVNLALAGTPCSSDKCPYIQAAFSRNEKSTPVQLEQLILRYAPATANAKNVEDVIRLMKLQVFDTAKHWAQSGGDLSEVKKIFGNASIGALIGGAMSGLSKLFFKADKGGAKASQSPQAVLDGLGKGSSMDAGTRSKMESSFGTSFSDVEVHADATAASLSKNMNARAFTVGNHIAFASGQHKPGTIMGDALMAHELAHVQQQRGAQIKGSGASYLQLENDADTVAQGVMEATL